MIFRACGPFRLKPSRLCGAALVAALSLATAPAFAQANNIEESLAPKRDEGPAVSDAAFDCPAFLGALRSSSDGFKSLRGPKTRESDGVAVFTANAPLFGACEIIEKKKLNEFSYSCQADKLSLADLKATIESCLGNKAIGLASNENPNTPYLRYNPTIDGVTPRVVAMATFGKKTLAIFSPH